jgi:hypothetical protein
VKFSKTHLLNLSISHKGQLNKNCLKSVYQLNKEFNILNKFDSITDALKYLKKDLKNGNITRVCKKKMKSAYGYYWCYCDDFDTLDRKYFEIHIKKTIIKIDIKSEKIIKEYNSLKETADKNNCHYTAISHLCNEKCGSINGFIFLFKKDYNPLLIKNIKKTIRDNYKLQMIDLNTNQVIRTFSSIKEAQIELNTKIHISSVCSGKRRHAGGYFWKKVFV